ncbi:MAG: hypothetical protein FWE13_01125 [Firmicutes bacterium]|nr:hypothetical protein [Bacillota bacterium]
MRTLSKTFRVLAKVLKFILLRLWMWLPLLFVIGYFLVCAIQGIPPLDEPGRTILIAVSAILATISLALAITFRPSRREGQDGERVKDDRPRIRPHKDSKERTPDREYNENKSGCPNYRSYDERDCNGNCYYENGYCSKKAPPPQFQQYKKYPSQECNNKYAYRQEEREDNYDKKYNESYSKNDNENNFSNNYPHNAYQQQVMDFNAQQSQSQYSQKSQHPEQQQSLYQQPSHSQEYQETPQFATYKPRNPDTFESTQPSLQEVHQKRSFFSRRNKSPIPPPEEKPLIFATRKDPNILIMEFSDRLLFFKKCPYGGEPEFLAEELKEG